ncbi:MAG: hypothetical protein VB089_01785 [Anaerolineaceae bacterium]|nr:hypothetical protein [Anaerolineaceae bacterium]
MPLPAFLFGLLAAALYGSIFHLWRGGSLGKYLFYVSFSCVGFWVGQYLAEQWGWKIFEIGRLHFGIASLGSLVFLGIGYWLVLVRIEGSEK